MTHYTNTANPVDFPRLNTVDRLWGKALDRAVPETYSSLTWTQVEKIKSVFAELIVKECCQKLEDDGMVEVAIEMKQHFGVES